MILVEPDKLGAYTEVDRKEVLTWGREVVEEQFKVRSKNLEIVREASTESSAGSLNHEIFPNDLLSSSIILLCAAAMYEGESRDFVEASVEHALTLVPDDPNEIDDKFPTDAEAVAPHTSDVIAEIRNYAGESE